MANFDMNWDDISGGSNDNNSLDYLKLQNGENRMRIVSAPSQLEIHWEEALDGSKKKIICLGPKCPICKKGGKLQTKYQMKVIDRADNTVKVLECGKQIVKAIKGYAVDPDYGDPTTYDIKIKKEGTGRDTRYTVVAVPNKTPLTEEEKEMVEGSPTIVDLNKIRTEDDIIGMQLKILADSIADLAQDDDFNDDDSDWDSL